jgi:hypothetical protein
VNISQIQGDLSSGCRPGRPGIDPLGKWFQKSGPSRRRPGPTLPWAPAPRRCGRREGTGRESRYPHLLNLFAQSEVPPPPLRHSRCRNSSNDAGPGGEHGSPNPRNIRHLTPVLPVLSGPRSGVPTAPIGFPIPSTASVNMYACDAVIAIILLLIPRYQPHGVYCAAANRRPINSWPCSYRNRARFCAALPSPPLLNPNSVPGEKQLPGTFTARAHRPCADRRNRLLRTWLGPLGYPTARTS